MASEISASTPVQWVRLGFDPIRSQVSYVGWKTDEDPPVESLIRPRTAAILTKAQTIMIR